MASGLAFFQASEVAASAGKTGGGEPDVPALTPQQERISALIGEQLIKGKAALYF